MAILKKGILGTPKGKIGNIMGYQKKGKGVIQRVPTVSNACMRIRNLSIPALKELLLFLWNAASVSIHLQWRAINDSSLSDFEYFLRTNMEISKNLCSRNLTGMMYAPAENCPPIRTTSTFFPHELKIQVSFNEFDLASSGVDFDEVWFTVLLKNGKRQVPTSSIYIEGVSVYFKFRSQSQMDNYMALMFHIQALLPSQRPAVLITDLTSVRT